MTAPAPANAANRHRLCGRDELEPNTARRFELDGRSIALVRLGEDGFYALGDRCSHADVSLAEGEVLADTEELECPKHGSAFSLRTGEPSCLPALRPVPTYDVFVEGDDVFVQSFVESFVQPKAGA